MRGSLLSAERVLKICEPRGKNYRRDQTAACVPDGRVSPVARDRAVARARAAFAVMRWQASAGVAGQR